MKAYDNLRWEFVIDMMKHRGFPNQFIGWVYLCLSTTSYSISVNGGLQGCFPGAKGLRQGDPLSHTRLCFLWTFFLNAEQSQ